MRIAENIKKERNIIFEGIGQIIPKKAGRDCKCSMCGGTITKDEACFLMKTPGTKSGIMVCPTCLFITYNEDSPVIKDIEEITTDNNIVFEASLFERPYYAKQKIREVGINKDKVYFAIDLGENSNFYSLGHTITKSLNAGYRTWFKGSELEGWIMGKPIIKK